MKIETYGKRFRPFHKLLNWLMSLFKSDKRYIMCVSEIELEGKDEHEEEN